MSVIVVVVLGLVVAVVLTAIWADRERRGAALALLDRVTPWRR